MTKEHISCSMCQHETGRIKDMIRIKSTLKISNKSFNPDLWRQHSRADNSNLLCGEILDSGPCDKAILARRG